MKLSKLTKKLLCTSLVAVGVITTMSGINANAADISGNINFYKTPDISDTYVIRNQSFYTSENAFHYYEGPGVTTFNYEDDVWNYSKGKMDIYYQHAYSVYNGTWYKIGSFNVY